MCMRQFPVSVRRLYNNMRRLYENVRRLFLVLCGYILFEAVILLVFEKPVLGRPLLGPAKNKNN